MFRFAMQVAQNPYFPRDVDSYPARAAISLDSDFPENTAEMVGERVLAEAFVLDCSASMSEDRFKHAKRALKSAIGILDKKAYFCVISGRHKARVVFPLSKAETPNKAMAASYIEELKPSGGTAMSTWLEAVRGQLSTMPDAIRHSIMLTDGKNENEPPESLFAELLRCEDIFQCDVRGVGTDWEPNQLRLIADRLMGTADIIPIDAEIERHFKELIEAVMRKLISNLSFRVWVPMGSRVEFVRQTYPTLIDLTDRGVMDPVISQLMKFSTGSWGREKRDFHVGVRLPTRNLGLTLCAGRFSAVTTYQGNETRLADAILQALLTDEQELSGTPDPTATHYAAQAEMAHRILEGLQARSESKPELATKLLGRAAKLAAMTNLATLELMKTVVDVLDARAGKIALRRDARKEDEFALNTRSTRMTRAKWPQPAAATGNYQPRVIYHQQPDQPKR